jgi:2'-5' RNA ligase
MDQQLNLPGFDHPAMGRNPPSARLTARPRRKFDRLFFGVFPDTLARARTSRVLRRLVGLLDLTGKPLPPMRRHVSLLHLGDYHHGLPDFVVAGARDAAATIHAAPFDVLFDRAESFHGGRSNQPLVLLGGETELAALIAFQKVLGGEMRRHGLALQVGLAFTPHLTLSYESRRLQSCEIEPVGWTVREFALIHSHYGEGRYTELGRWPIDG